MNHKQTFGYIIKKEQLESAVDLAPKGVMLLGTSNPFPGYHDNLNGHYYYLVLDTKTIVTIDDLIRITQRINRPPVKKFDICSSEITLYNKPYKALRLYDLEHLDIDFLIGQYQMYGIHFLKNQAVKEFMSLIKVYKFLELSEIHESIYESDVHPAFKYIQIPDKLGWTDFEFLVATARTKKSFDNCDFALASAYSKEGFDDFIRIISANCQLEKLISFRTFILSAIHEHAIK